MAARKSKSAASLADQCREVLRHLELGKKHYKLADRGMDAVLKQMEPGQTVKLSENGRVVTLKDNFAEGKTQAFKAARFHRYELEVTEPL